MISKTLLLTQCLQNDFVRPFDRYESVPNQLHIGFEEARRLVGDPKTGPVASAMLWAYNQPESELGIIHIRDWHDQSDPAQEEHFRQFGPHCLKNTQGAEFAFPVENQNRQVEIVDSPGLNDFLDTRLEAVLQPYKGLKTRVGIMGVWTEAKIFFLAYDLRTRFPQMELGICSALCASSSRAHHFMALEHLQKILGVRVFPSVGEFVKFLGGDVLEIPLPAPCHADLPRIESPEGYSIRDTDKKLIRYLFRDCSEVKLKPLDGGFSGNLVCGTESIDIQGHHQVPHVIKIGAQEAVGKERTSFEQIENVLGNNAPSISEFADLEGRGALKYRYASMGGGFSQTFQKLFMSGAPLPKIKKLLDTVFKEQLGRLYSAGRLQRENLFQYYWFKPAHGEKVQQNIQEILGRPISGNEIEIQPGIQTPNPVLFYQSDLKRIHPYAENSWFFSFVHGDLNGANIIVDGHENVWIIDFFHTHRGHILRDLIKLENDLCYIFTQLSSDLELKEGCEMVKILLKVKDLSKPLPDLSDIPITSPALKRCYEIICHLRGYYPSLIQLSRDPLQMFIAQLRYSAHTLSFDEPSLIQKKWALFTTGYLTRIITRQCENRGKIRVDWLPIDSVPGGLLGMTILPGRKDVGREIKRDLEDLKTAGVQAILTLVTFDELEDYGVKDLFLEYKAAGFEFYHQPILDQGSCPPEEMAETLNWIEKQLSKGKNVMAHCVGGLGRSGLVTACFLKKSGYNSEEALQMVRKARNERAVESKIQEEYLLNY